MKNSHATKKATKNLQEGDRELAQRGIAGTTSGSPLPFVTEALATLADDLTALSLAASNPETPLSDEIVNYSIFRLGERARSAHALAERMQEEARRASEKSGGAT